MVAVTSSSGSVTNSYTYDPFGVTTETKALLTNVFNPWRYTGQYQDVSTGLYKIGARYYQAELGRWSQLDPVPGELPYAYAGNNPANFIDPTGTYCVLGTYGGPGGACRGGSVDNEDAGIGKAAKSCAVAGAATGAAGTAGGAITGGVPTGGIGAGPGAALGYLSGYVTGCIAGAATSGLNDLDR